MSFLQMRTNQKASSSMKVLRRNANQNASKQILTQKNAKNEAEYEKPSVIYYPVVKEPSFFTIFECGKNILNRLQVMYEQACMATLRDKYYTKMLETLVDYNDHNNATLSNENLRQKISKVVV